MSGDVSNEDSTELVCEACGEPFDSEAELRTHVRQVGIAE